MNAKVAAVNTLLLDGEPGNISTDEHAGYTGYRPQAVIDAMNEVFWGEWGFEEISSSIEAGDKGGLVVAQVQVWLKDVTFRPTSYGQNRITRGDIGDARKGAQTDAIKKALSYFSIGNRAYQGLLEAGNNGRQPVTTVRPVQSRPVLRNGDGSPVVVAKQQPAHTLMEVKEFFLKYFKPTQWRGFKDHELGMEVEDGGLTDKELETLWKRLMLIDEDAKARGKVAAAN